MKRLLYGSKRERFIKDADENQMALPFDVPENTAPEKQEKTITYVRKKSKRTNHPRRMALPDHFPVEEIVIKPAEDTSGMKCTGKDITHQNCMAHARRKFEEALAYDNEGQNMP